MGSSLREQILKRLDRHYISPLTQFYLESELLKRAMLGRPSRVQIAMPDSWRINRYLPAMARLNRDEATARLQIFERYLDSDHSSVFAYDKPLVLGDSFPYFEWVKEGKVMGLNDLLGVAQLFYLYKGNDESTQLLYELIKDRDLMPYLHILGELPSPILGETVAQGFSHIQEISRPFLENIVKGRTFTNLFNQSADILLMDRFGHYVKGYTRAEFTKQIDQIIEEYFRGA